MRVLGVIPARFGSTRFPGKVLADIGGKPMLWHVYRQARKARLLDSVVVATDHEAVVSACAGLDIPVVMTRADHATGTDRVAEVAAEMNADVFVNVQGDEPMVDPVAIDAVIAALKEGIAANGCAVITEPGDVVSPNVVKVVTDVDSNALMFSRAPMPHPKDARAVYRRQLGLYALKWPALQAFVAHKPGPLERCEGVEMLRLVEHGYRVRMVEVEERGAIAVDTPHDLERVRARMAA